MSHKLKLHKRRAVSEIIGTLLIIAVTVAGAVFLSNAMQNSFFSPSSGSATSDVRPENVQLIGFDTRDSVNLSDITDLNNLFNPINPSLLTDGATAVDKIPLQGGTEFIILHLRNRSINSVYLQNVLINNYGHTWDTVAAGDVLVPTFGGATTGQFPADGKFSILPITNGTGPSITQKATNEIVGDEEVRVIVKLSGIIPQDIGMWEAVRVVVNYGGSEPAEFIILSGDAKW